MVGDQRGDILGYTLSRRDERRSGGVSERALTGSGGFHLRCEACDGQKHWR